MISYLRLTNFRRHVDTELYFNESDQVVLVAGNNGVGKSTLFEAVLYALYGEGRNGRGNLERLVRKGGELEGLEVELRFDVAGVSYNVRRRRDSKISSAVLSANDIPLVEGAREVTAEVIKVLGMDSRGFKLATYAQQRELDGLASMRAADRGQMLSRLLQLDVISRAKESARGEFRQRREVLRAIGSGGGVENVESQLASVRKECATIKSGLDAARAQIAILDAEIAAGGETERAYQAAKAGQVRLEALVQAAEADVVRIQGELSSIVIPEERKDLLKSLEQLQQESTDIERKIAEGEAAKRQVAQLRSVQAEISRCEERLVSIESFMQSRTSESLEDLQQKATKCHIDGAAAAQKQGELRDSYVALRERAEQTRKQLGELESLDGECPTCRQDISSEHKASHVDDLQKILAEVEADLERVKVEGVAAKEIVASLSRDAELLDAQIREKLREAEESERLLTEQAELSRRLAVYKDQAARLNGTDGNLDYLYTRRAEILVESNLAIEIRESAILRRSRLEQQEQAGRTLASAVARRDAHRIALSEGSVSLDLALAYEHLQSLSDARRNESEVAGELQATLAGLEERERTLMRDLARVKEESERKATVDKEAQIALYSAQALERVETLWAQQIRPSLEGTVSELVARLSDGRFDAVQFDADYDVSVRDRGVMRPIGELSGGEIDLVSLAVRLGLASVVSERHGGGGVGFLILDECFGSQDPDRRVSIMNALRGLKQTHGQIFLISHVGGLEDSADAVIEVEIDEDSNAVAVRT